MAVYWMGALGVSVRELKALLVKMETETLIGQVSVRKVKAMPVKMETQTLIAKDRQKLTCFLY
jgi:hypothetical protein